MMKRCLWSGVFVLASATVYAETRLYDLDAALDVTIEAPLSDIDDAKDSAERAYFDGNLHVTTPDGDAATLTVGLRARGNFRRKNCKHIPLQLNFKKSEVADSFFAGQNKIKLVRPCGPGKKFGDWLLLEYLSYRAWAQVSDHHFRTQLLEVTFVNTNGGKPRKTLAFIIESDNDTAKRLGGDMVESPPNMTSLNEDAAALLELFQFFLGNNDYALVKTATGRSCCHNSRLVSLSSRSDGYVPIPYDFDHAGIVNASYARPPDALMSTISSVTERYFTGACKTSADAWTAAIATMTAQRDALRALYNDRRLSNRARLDAIKFIDAFFAIIDDPAQVEAFIVARCQPVVSQGIDQPAPGYPISRPLLASSFQ